MAKTFFTVVLVIAVVVAAYAALAFFVFHDLPPNHPVSGRLPSLYLMLGGMAGMLVGAVGRNFRLSGKS